MKFPVDLLLRVSQEELEQSAERYMKNLLLSDPDDPERLTISGSAQTPIDVSSVGLIPLYGFEKQKILALFTASDKFTAVGLYLSERWWPVEDILKTADATRDGALEVKTVGERIVLYVLNRIIYRAREMSHDELPFLCHGKQDYAKILWKDGEAVGFYSVKCTGSRRNSHSSMTFQLPVMDSMFVRKSHRGKGFGLQMLEDYVQSFEEDSLGLRRPLTKSMYKVCEKFLGQYPGDTDLLWEVEGIGEPRQRTNIANKIQAMDLSVSKTLSFSEEMVKSAEAAQKDLVMDEISTRLDDMKSMKCTVEILEEVTLLTVSNDMPVVGRNHSSGSGRRKTREKTQTDTSEKVIRVEDIEAETPSEVQLEVKPTGVLSSDEKGESLDRSSAEDLVIVAANSVTDIESPDSEEPVVASVNPPEETQVQDDATCLTTFSSNSLITVENVVSESQKTEAECQNEAQTCMSTECHDTVTEEMQTAVIDDKEDTISHGDRSHLDSVNVFEDINGTKSQRISVKTTKSLESETLTRMPLRHSTLDGEIALRGRTLQVTLIHTKTSQTQKVSEKSVEEFNEVAKELPEDTDEFVKAMEAGHGQATTEISINEMNESYETNLEKEEEEKLQDEESLTEVTQTVDGREMATASETETNDEEADKQIKETCQMEPEEEDKEKSEEEIPKAESNVDGILVPTNMDETNETENDTGKETINQPATEAEEERAGDEVSTIEEITSQNLEPNESLNKSVIPVAEKTHDEETDDSIHKLQEATVILVDLKSTINQFNMITPDKKCSSKTEEKSVETEREVSICVVDGQTEPNELLEDLVGQKGMVDATTEMEISEQKESEMQIRETRVLRSAKKSKRVSSRKSKSALQEEISIADISSNKEVDLPVREGDLSPENILPNKMVREMSSEKAATPVVETRTRRVSQKLTVTPRSSRRIAAKKGVKISQEEHEASPTRTLRHGKSIVYATPTRKYRQSHRVTNEDEKTGEHVEDDAMNKDSAIEHVDKKDDEIDETNLNEDEGKASSEGEQIKLDLGENVASTISEPLDECAKKAASEEASANDDDQSSTITRVLRSGKKILRGHKTFQNEAEEEEEEEAKKIQLDKETNEEIIQVEEPVTAEMAFPIIAEDDAVQEEENIASAEGKTSEEATSQLSHMQNVTIDLVDLRRNEEVHKPVSVETATVDTVQDNSDMENKNDEIIEETEAPTIETRVLRSGKKIRLGNKASSQPDEEDRECTLAAEETKIAVEECEDENKDLDGRDKDKIETETLVQKVDQTGPTGETDQAEDVNKPSPTEPNTVEEEQCAEEQNEEEMTSAADTQVEETKAALEESEEVEICFEKVKETSESETNTYKEDQTMPEVEADQKTVEDEALLLKETSQDMQDNSTPVRGEETFRKIEEETIIATPDDNEQIEEGTGAATTTDDDEPLLEGKKLRKGGKSTVATPQRESKRVRTRLQQKKQEESAPDEDIEKHTKEALEESEEDKISTEKADETASHEEELGVAIDQAESVALVIVTDIKMAEEKESGVAQIGGHDDTCSEEDANMEIQNNENEQAEGAAEEEDVQVVETRMLRRSQRSTQATKRRKSKRTQLQVEETKGNEIEASSEQPEEEIVSHGKIEDISEREVAAQEIEHSKTEVEVDQAKTVALVTTTELKAVEEQQSVTETCKDMQDETPVGGSTEDEDDAVDKETAEMQDDDNRQAEGEATDEDGAVVEPRMLRSRRYTPTTPQRKSKRSHKRHQVEEAQGEETENTYNRERENVTDEAEASITLQDTEDGVGDETREEDESKRYTRVLRKGRKSMTVTPRSQPKRACIRQPEDEKDEQSSPIKETQEVTTDEKLESETDQKETEVGDQDLSELNEVEAEVSPIVQENVEEEQSVVSETCLVGQEDVSVSRNVEETSSTDTKMFFKEAEANTTLQNSSEQESQAAGEESSEEAEPLVEKRALRKRGRHTPTTSRRKSKRTSKKHQKEEDEVEETNPAEETEEEEDETRQKQPELEGEMAGEREGGADNDQVESQLGNAERTNDALTADTVQGEAAICTEELENTTKYIIQSSLSEAGNSDEEGKDEQSSPIKETQEVTSDEKTESETNQKVTEVGDQDLSELKEVEAEVSPMVQENAEEEQSVVSETCLVGQEDVSVSRNVEETSSTDTQMFFKEAEANTTLQNLSEQESQAAGEESSEEAEPLVEKRALRKRGRHTPTTSRRKSKRTSKKHRTEEDKVEEANPAEETEEEPTVQGEAAICTETLENTTKYIIQSSLSDAGNSDKEGNAIIEEKLISSTELESEPVIDEAENEEAFLVTQVLQSETKTWLVTPSQSSTSENTEEKTLLSEDETLNHEQNKDVLPLDNEDPEQTSLIEQEAVTDNAEDQHSSNMIDNKEAESDLAEDNNEQESEHSTNEKTKQLNEELESEAQEDIPELSLDTDEVEEGGTEDMSEDEIEPIVITRRELRGRSVPEMIITPRSKSRRSSGRVHNADESSSDEERSPQSQMRSNRKRRSTEGTPGHRAKRHSRV